MISREKQLLSGALSFAFGETTVGVLESPTKIVNNNAANFEVRLLLCLLKGSWRCSPHLQERWPPIGWSPGIIVCMDFAESTPTTRITVLVIDDNYNDRKHWSNALRRPSFNYLVLEASDAEDGRNLLRNHKVDCVVLDFDMPLSGYFTLIELVPDRERPKIPVIMLTCLANPVLSELTKDAGAQAWLVKQNTSAEDLHQAVQKAIASVKSLRGS